MSSGILGSRTSAMDDSRRAYEALNAVLSDDHSPEAGDAALREIIAIVASEEGENGLQRLAFDAIVKLAELTERFAFAQQLSVVDVADILFLD
jgi:hypothetical protein